MLDGITPPSYLNMRNLMKKIFALFTQSLLALLLTITPLFSPSLFAAPNEAENLEAWAKMF